VRSSDDTNGYVNRSLRSLRIARGIRLLRGRLQTKSVSAPSVYIARSAVRDPVSTTRSAYFIRVGAG
jgi:hypothetical protein